MRNFLYSRADVGRQLQSKIQSAGFDQECGDVLGKSIAINLSAGINRVLPAEIMQVERWLVRTFEFATWNLERRAGFSARFSAIDNDERRASSRGKHHCHAVGSSIEQHNVRARTERRILAQDADHVHSRAIVRSIGIAASDNGDHDFTGSN